MIKINMATKKTIKKTVKKISNKPQTKKVLDFDPVLCIEQYEKLQNIGAAVCGAVSRAVVSDSCYELRCYEYKRVGRHISDKDSVSIYHGCTWWTVPTDIITQGVDATVQYIKQQYEAKLKAYKTKLEAEKKVKLKKERERDLREYNRLKEKLFGKRKND